MRDPVLDGYAAAASDLTDRFERISSQDLFAPVVDFLPRSASRVLDVGAGTGRDAAWFAARGHAVVAVEPVEPLRAAGRRSHPHPRITWQDATLPALADFKAEPFDLIVVVAVWHHLRRTDRGQALRRLAEVLKPNGRLIISIREGASAPDRVGYSADVSQTVAMAHEAGMAVVHKATTPSVQTQNKDADVAWTWLVLEASAPL